MMDAEDIVVSYGSRPVLHGCDVHVGSGEVVALFGHNGAGKTSLLRTLAGLKQHESGSIRIAGRDVSGMPASRRARHGVAFVPDGAAGVFANLTVEENIAVAGSGRKSRHSATLKLVKEMFPVVMDGKRRQLVSQLSGGQRQMVALALAMIREPKVMLLDEPSIGLAPVVVQQMLQAVKQIAERLGSGVLIVEQDMPAALAISDRVHIMKQGVMVLSAVPGDFPSADALWKYF